MTIADDVAAVQRRIVQISSAPIPPSTSFSALVEAGLDDSNRFAPPAPRATPRPEIERLVRIDAAAYGVDSALIDAVIANESGFDTTATSSAGARGLMQLMPQTAAALGVSDAYDPAQNVRAGTRYLRGLLDRFGDVELAVAAYNAGPAAVERYGGVPPYAQTQSYVRNVLARYRTVLNSATSR